MPTPQKEPRLRIIRLQSLVQELLGKILPEYLGETNALVTVNQVEISGDMRHAKVWLSVLGGDDKVIFKIIEKHIYAIQGELNRELPMKLVPRLQFNLDTSPRYAEHISELINQIHADDHHGSAQH
ncbi:MAG: ribosome-binding factor A [Candidatus Doudnabacteria bacterium]|nr:ribosome-binding factor A [Candidatus Doudnabacteria bacterium]